VLTFDTVKEGLIPELQLLTVRQAAAGTFGRS
jgi:hypothetical protein